MRCRNTGVIATVITIILLVAGCTGGSDDAAAGSASSGDITADSPFGLHPAGIYKPGYSNNGYGDARNIGVKWARQGIYAYWFIVQPDLNKQKYDFSKYDHQWSEIPVGINILANIAPQGPVDEGYCLPDSYVPVDTRKYAAFVAATVERYDGDGIDDMPGLTNPIKYWQVGNEPNGLKPGFANLQKVTYSAIKGACPDCKVLIGGVPGMPPAEEYIKNFDQQYKPILDDLGGEYVDIMDFHWFGHASGDYLGAKDAYNHIRSVLNADGFSAGLPVWITEMGTYSGNPAAIDQLHFDFPPQTESQQAADYFKRFIYPLSFGVKKIFPAFGLMEGLQNVDDYFDHTGLIYDGFGTEDLGLGVKKLGYYTYKKMTEELKGSDWNSIQAIVESDHVYVYRFQKSGKPVYVAWWDYFNESLYAPDNTKQLTITGLQGTAAIVTEVVPKFATGAEVSNYATAFKVSQVTIANGSATLTLGESPVFVEVRR